MKVAPGSPTVVLKFGGTSVATAGRWMQVADRVRPLCQGRGQGPRVIGNASEPRWTPG